MLFKIVALPDSEIVGDMGTYYILTEHKGFIEALESIKDYKVMICFLDKTQKFYIEILEKPEHFDKELNVSPFHEWRDDLDFSKFMIFDAANLPYIDELKVR